MELIKIKLKDIQTYSESEQFKQFAIKPISPLRIKSYLNNPRADQDDFVLYMLIRDNELLAFRTILTDSIRIQGKEEKFGWYSGTWVHPKYRRLGFSKKLFYESFGDWNKKMMFTNYAESSKSLYLESNSFSMLRERVGMRFYLFPDLYDILKKKKGYSHISWLLFILSGCIEWCVKIKLPLLLKGINQECSEIDYLDEACQNYLKEYHPESLFGRGIDELSWILSDPWVTEKAAAGFNYPFSYSGIKFKMRIVKIIDRNQMTGFFIYSLVNRKMKIIYYFTNKPEFQQMVQAILKIAINLKISHLTILEPQLAAEIKNIRRYSLFLKN